MTHCYLLVEALNFDSTVFDTNQISIIRGSSLLATEAIRRISEDILGSPHEVISTGASSGLFRLPESSDTQGLILDIKTLLCNTDSNSAPPFGTLVFGIECCRSSDYQTALAVLRSRLNTHQMQNISCVPDRGTGSTVCHYTGTRASDDNCTVTLATEDPRHLSKNAYQRFAYGRIHRDKQYELDKHSLGDQYRELQQRTTPDLQALASCQTMGNLNNKIAIIYADGNRFSQVRNQTDAAGRSQIQIDREFDAQLQKQRAHFRNNMIASYSGDTERFSESSLVACDTNVDVRQLRLETLLWGGDDMLFVVPAWYGFDWLNSILEYDWTFGQQKLTHAAGLVFCSVKTPIVRARGLAYDLCEHVKARQRASGSDPVSAYEYVTLESVDYPTVEHSHYLKKRYGNSLASIRPHYIKPGIKWTALHAACNTLINERYLSARAAHTIVQNAHNGTLAPYQQVDNWHESITSKNSQTSQLLELEKRYLSSHAQMTLTDICEQLMIVFKGLGCTAQMLNDDQQRIWCWIHLYELWNYLAPVSDQHSSHR